MKQKKRLRIGMIGAGRIAKIHAYNIAHRVSEAEVAAVCDKFADSASEMAALLNISDVYTDYNSILGRSDVDAVCICTPTETHAEISIAAARAGKHVLCEKPVDLETEKIERVIEEVEKSGIVYQVAFNRRFDASYGRVAKMVQSGAVGEVQTVLIVSRDPKVSPVSYLRKSGGLYLDMGVHDFDMVRFVSGQEVAEVTARGACLVDPAVGEIGDVDTAVTTMRLSNGALAVVIHSRQAVYGYDQRLEVFGSLGMARAENRTEDSTILYTAESVVTDRPLWNFTERFKGAYLEEMRCFVDSCLHQKPVTATIYDGLCSVRIGLAARESQEKGGIPVRLDGKPECGKGQAWS